MLSPDPVHQKIIERWSHKNEGTPETHEKAARTQEGAIARLFTDGYIDKDQLQWAQEIHDEWERVIRGIQIRVVAYQPRIDCQSSGRDVLVERIEAVHREMAYSWWRSHLPKPADACIAMLTAECQPYSQVCKQYRMGKVRMRAILIRAIDLWPEALERARKEVDEGDMIAAHAGLMS